MLLPSLNFGALSLWMETEWADSTCVSTGNGYASDGVSEESVMSEHGFFLRWRWPPLRSGSASPLSNQSSMTWFKPPTAVGELHENRFMKMFNFFLLDCSRLSVLSQTQSTKTLNFPSLSLLLSSVLSPSDSLPLSLHFGRYRTNVFASKN